MMILDRRGFSALLLAAAASLATAPALAQPGPAGPDPRRWVEGRLGAVTRLLAQSGDAGAATAARDAQVARILNGMLDIEELGRRALDPYFGQQSAADQAAFVSLLRQLIERNYRNNLESTLSWAVTYGAGTTAADGTVVVPTTARSRTNTRTEPVTIDYHLRRRANDWIVYDIVTNRSSLVQSYRDGYTRIVRDRGFPELLRRLRQRVAALGTGAAVNP
ncbi:MAG: ABC transporter substrate-binding protein [Deltaproteobacteria bacterium]|nr:ABC transporter substrate-binding protein [Myxococcales bacterium]MDP3217914.1 ABC transporter substrate-binding protein [Deltaproteobacteria bacterium]